VKRLAALTLFMADAAMAQGWAIRRVADMPDGAPAFVVLNLQGQVATRINCINNGWYDPDSLAVRLLRSTEVMATIVARQGRLTVDDLGPAKFDCVIGTEK
jgi:porphobilinogen deaminase